MKTIAFLLLFAYAPQPPQPQPPTAAGAAQDDYVIGVSDIITVTVFGEPEASRSNVTVDSDGTIDMPFIGRVKVAGLTTRAVEQDVKVRVGKYLVNPAVNVEMVRYRSKMISVQGHVHSPGVFPLEGNVSLTSAIAKAGSPTLTAGSYVIISRRAEKGGTEEIKVSRKDIESGKAQNIFLKDGDTVMVPKAETFYINGQVRATGSFTWEEGLTVERALSLAGGANERAGNISIDRNGKTITKKAKKTDPVLANDIIRVGTRIW